MGFLKLKENFLKQFANKIIEKYQSKTIKIFDIWQNLNDDILIDLPSFVYSWTSKRISIIKSHS